MKNQTKESCIIYVYKRKKESRDAVLKELLCFFNKRLFKEGENKDYSFAFGKIRLNIDTFFQEEDNGFSAEKWFTPVISGFGNINGKMSNKLFWKDSEIKKHIEKASIEFDNINRMTSEAINVINEDYPNQTVSHAIIWAKINPGAF